MIPEHELKRLYWHSRRGMLELDLLLVPFARDRLGELDERRLGLYRELLAEEDQDLFVWLVHGRQPPRESLGEIVALVRDHASPAEPS